MYFSLRHKWKSICLTEDYTFLQSEKNTFPEASLHKNVKYQTGQYFLKGFKKLGIFFIWLTLKLTVNKPFFSRSKSKVHSFLFYPWRNFLDVSNLIKTIYVSSRTKEMWLKSTEKF